MSIQILQCETCPLAEMQNNGQRMPCKPLEGKLMGLHSEYLGIKTMLEESMRNRRQRLALEEVCMDEMRQATSRPDTGNLSHGTRYKVEGIAQTAIRSIDMEARPNHYVDTLFAIQESHVNGLTVVPARLSVMLAVKEAEALSK